MSGFFKRKYARDLKSSQGFTLIEILVALTLMAMILFIIPNPFENSSRKAIEEVSDNMIRALKMSVDESILRGTLTRVNLEIGKNPQTYVLEFGDKTQSLLPDFKALNPDQGLSLQEQDQVKTKLDQFDKNFNPIDDFSSKAIEMSEDVAILGAATNLHPKLVDDGPIAIYSYPSGERDSAIIFLGTTQEVIALTMEAFTGEVQVDYFALAENGQEVASEVQKSKVDELYQRWVAGDPIRPK